MIIKKICKTVNKHKRLPYIGLDEKGSLWILTGSLSKEKEWIPIEFNELYAGYYPACQFTAICATEKDFVAAGMGEDGLPYVFRSLMGGVWESADLLCGNLLMGYKRAVGKIVEILYDFNTKQLFMICENGELLTLPDCPKCAKICNVSEERILGGHFSEDGSKIILITVDRKEVPIEKESISQIRVTSDFARKRIEEGGDLVDLRKMSMEATVDWLKTQPKEKCILFLCEYGVQSDQAAKYARSIGYHQAYSMGGVRLQFYTTQKETL